MPRILCYGDSNTWGYDPQADARLDGSVRWPGALAALLGSEFTVIEEGLIGRTTNRSYPHRPGRNGSDYLAPCLDSHFPLDVVVLMLGTNDAKEEFGCTAEQIAAGMDPLVDTVLGKGLEDPSPDVRVILVAPPPVREIASNLGRMRGASAKIAALGPLYRELSIRRGLGFVDLSDLEPSPQDGIHLTASGHAEVARRVADRISQGLPTPVRGLR